MGCAGIQLSHRIQQMFPVLLRLNISSANWLISSLVMGFFRQHLKNSRGNSYCICVIGDAYDTLVMKVTKPGCILHKHVVFEDSCPSNFRGWRAQPNE